MSPKMRHKSRKILVQAMYQWAMTGDNLSAIEMQFRSTNEMQHLDDEYFHELLHAIPAQISELDKTFQPFLQRAVDEISPVELAVLRVGTYELKERLDIPYRVVINEGVEMAKTFGAEDAHKFVNSVLDRVAQTIRKDEQK
ncbi:N utilization substance protein B [Piscirickettsia salmonis]|uniref:Transcription antitermination protein NusB n=3 Tax=Piscirickettsia salmonis TaxID=1238 RepID=A0A1L6TD95_PISSA|nr:transcription antitermination factor NusB [Piscirickettsia salmonis]AKP74426.1 N utilization substance protein B [Piscirickettsia salmonis LF-89 = ATCC VR-1361]ALB23393.1 transcription antitermination factor NusB [Piscirickettsia salmonis]ALY03281.1 N utilization substance protein B [Piscirickettsia salmonis]AMA42848.1 N utilization substance protein B [Piscirickettsia salmonis]AOS35315.1 N utilization substance protein B [Piscirickettsia salmonis]